MDADGYYWLSAEAFGDNKDAGYDSLTGTYKWETTLGYDKEKVDYHFAVTFVDDVDRDGLRPGTVAVELLADGAKADTRTVEVNRTDSMYAVTWKNLDVNKAGKPITYSIRLAETPDGYETGYNELRTEATLTHDPELVSVVGTIEWDDSTQLVDVTNANGTYVRSYEPIARADAWMQLYADGEPCGEPVLIGSEAYGSGERKDRSASRAWHGLYRYRDGGTEIDYTMEVGSDGLAALLADGHGLAYDFGTACQPKATVTHDLYDIRGTVYYMYNYNKDFLLRGVPVTAYLQKEDGSYEAAGTVMTDESGRFEMTNLPQGLYIVRATYAYGQNTLAGTKGLELDRKDGTVELIVNRDAVNDSTYYKYTAAGAAYYQTDATDPGTRHAVPEGSVVLLYRLDNDQADPVYSGMTTTDDGGRYAFGGLNSGDYIVNVVFNYGGGVYTYDNGDARSDGLRFVISGADAAWGDIVKQVNASADPNDPDNPDNPGADPDPVVPVPCVTGGHVFYAENGTRTEDPVAGVDVYVYVKTNNAEAGHAVTGADGRWSVEGLGAADYVAVFSYRGNASRVLVFGITDADYDAGTYEAAPQYFDRAVETAAGIIRGTVLDEHGGSVRALAGIYDSDGTLRDFAYTDANGGYTFTVAAGSDYNVRILSVEDKVTRIPAGYPGDGQTTLDYYVLSGTFSIDGTAQAGRPVAVYYETDGRYDMVTATMTDGNGRFSVKVYDEGNYRVCPYVDANAYEIHDVSVGYRRERPAVGTAVNGSYTVSGTERYQSLVLYKVVNSVETIVYEESGVNASAYEIRNLDAGRYRLKLVDGGRETLYHLTCPEGTLVETTPYVTVSGCVKDGNGNPVIGAEVAVYDGDGKLASEPVTTLSDGRYSYSDLPKGGYTVVVTEPNTGEVMADKWTYEQDSYGKAYEGGMAAGGAWVWNINAFTVSGKVADQNGEPIAGAHVTFTAASGPESGYTATTDDNGEYAIGLAPGAYSAGAVYRRDTAHAYHSTGAADLKLEGDMADLDFTITRHALTIRTERAADGATAPGAEVSVSYEGGAECWTGSTDETGTATVAVFPGRYLVSCRYDGSDTVATSKTVINDTTVVLKPDSPVYVTGTVRDADGSPVADGLVHYRHGSSVGHVYTDDDGRYVIAVGSGDLGEYEIHAARGAETGAVVTVSVHMDTEADLTVGGGEAPEESHAISGVVSDEDGNRLANALVTIVWGDDKSDSGSKTTSTNSRGEYGFTVADGTYYITAAYEAANGNRYETNAEYVVHVNGADARKNLTVLVGYDVEVTVVDADGNAIPDAAVIYTGTESGKAATDSDGKAALHLPKGEYVFQAKTASRTSEAAELTVSGRRSVTLELEKAGIAYEKPAVADNGLTVWGWVYAPDGEPVEGADVKLYRQDLETLKWIPAGSAVTGDDGRYEFLELEDGTYRVDTAYTHVTEAEASEAGHVVSGVLEDEYGNPLSNATVELWTEAGKLVGKVDADDDGKYVFEGVDPDVSYVVKARDAAGERLPDEPGTVTATSTVVSGATLDVAGNVVPRAGIVIRDSEGNTVATTVSDETGHYSVAVSGASDGYQVVVSYPASYEVDTASYERDTKDRNAPYLKPSWYTIEGCVHDKDGNPAEGADVVLTDASGAEVASQVTGEDGRYVFDHLEDGTYYVRVTTRDGTEQDYRVDLGDSSDNIDVTVTNYARGAVIKADGWYDGRNSFTVESGLACMVYVSGSDGSMTRLSAEATDEADTYRFTADLSDGDEILVMVIGDANGDGRLTGADVVSLSRYLGGEYEPPEHGALAADVTGEGRVTGADLVRLSKYFGGEGEISW